MKWADPIRDFFRSINVVHPVSREPGEHEKEKTKRASLTLRELPLKYGFDTALSVRLIIAALLFSAALVFRPTKLWSVFLLALSALLAGYDLMIDSILRIVRLRQYDERILVFLVSLLAFLFPAYYEGTAVMLLYQFGCLIKRAAAGRARSTATEALSVHAQQATVLRAGKAYAVGIHDVSVGETVVIEPGETVTFDGIILKGESEVDLSALTGEAVPVRVEAGDALLAGSLNLESVLFAEVRARAGESNAEKLLRLIRPEKLGRSAFAGKLEKLCAVFTPVIFVFAILYAGLLPLFTEIPFAESLRRALILLLAAGSASFVQYFPALYQSAIGSAAKHGILFRSSNAMEQAGSVDRIVVEQSGTLTSGRQRVSSVKTARSTPEALLRIAAHACANSEQPLAKAIVAGNKEPIYIELIRKFQDFGKDGVCVEVDGAEIVVGAAQLLRRRGVYIPENDISAETAWYVSIASSYAGRILFADNIKAEASKTIQDLSAEGCTTVLITDQSGSEKENVFRKLGLTDIQYASGTEEIADKITELKTHERKGRNLLYVGSESGNFDSFPKDVLSASLNGLENVDNTNTANILILSENPGKIVNTIQTAKYVRKLAIENTVLITGIKLILIILALLGKNTLWIAALINTIADALTILQIKRIELKK